MIETGPALEHRSPSPVPFPRDVRIHRGPALLAGVGDEPSLSAHRTRYGTLPSPHLSELFEMLTRLGIRGRGGAAFPFATKLQAASRGRRPVVVVNLSEGEPASSKDSSLAEVSPHLVLDGAVATATALGTRDVHVVLPAHRLAAAHSMRAAVEERTDRIRFTLHQADPRFVSGQARAVIELLAGRENLPVTAWTPEAVAGLRGRPTLLSNAETWAHVGLVVLRGSEQYARLGTRAEPGTTLLTVTVPGCDPEVHEVAFGSRLNDVLPVESRRSPALVGGFHGSWASGPTLYAARVSVPGMRALGAPLGAGVILAPGPDTCALTFTSLVVDHLAAESSGRCGPCFNGLPALAEALRRVRDGTGGAAEVGRLADMVAGRGACAHPDGTVRLVRSLFAVIPDELEAHGEGACTLQRRGVGR